MLFKRRMTQDTAGILTICVVSSRAPYAAVGSEGRFLESVGLTPKVYPNTNGHGHTVIGTGPLATTDVRQLKGWY